MGRSFLEECCFFPTFHILCHLTDTGGEAGMGHVALWPQQQGPNQIRKQDLTLQGRIWPTGTRHVERQREGLGQHECSRAVSLSLCTEYNTNNFRRKRFPYQML